MSVGGIVFGPPPAPSFLACLLFGVRRHLCPSRVMPWYPEFQTPFAGVMLRYRVYFSATYPYYFDDRLVSIPNHAIHLVPLATLTDLGYQKRVMPASLVFPPLPYPFILFFGRVWIPFVCLMMMWSWLLCLATWSSSPSSPVYPSRSSHWSASAWCSFGYANSFHTWI